MPTKIKSVRELPEWFDIRRYDAARELDVIGWNWQLGLRWSVAINYEIAFTTNGEAKVKNLVDWYFNMIAESPIVTPHIITSYFITPYEEEAQFDCMDKLLSAMKRRSAVRSLTMMDAYLLGEDVRRWPALFATCRKGASESRDWSVLEQINKPFDLAHTESWVGLDGITHVVVDLDASDEHLINDFKVWLSCARKNHEQSRVGRLFTEKDFSAWHKWRVLAYMDLTFWAGTHGFEITYRILEEALFPGEYVTDRARHTVRRLVKRLCSPPVMKALERQASQKLAGSQLKAVAPMLEEMRHEISLK